jgi:RNA polymerase sigma-70 factor (ECF subfamily)
VSDSIEELCGRAKAGDLLAASELITHFYEKIFAYFYRLSGNQSEAADLTQKAFCKVWSSLAAFQGRSSFSTWLHGISHHVYVDWRRRKNLSDTQTDEWWATCPSDAPGPFEDAVERDGAHRLYALVEQLDEVSREVIHLHYYQGLSLRETADVLNVAASTVKYRLREALGCLKSRAAEPKMPTN